MEEGIMSTPSAQTAGIEGYQPGRWNIDPVHSDVSFSVRHMMVSKVRGKFSRLSGFIVTGTEPLSSSVEATIELDSFDTANEQRDAHIRSADFLDVANHPQMTFRSTGVRPDGSDFLVDGDLSLHGDTKPVTLHLEIGGFGPDAYGGTRAGFSATTEIDRTNFGVDLSMPMATGGVVIGEKVTISLDVEAVLETA
jgi:polyisoprenoid-binding protein YceI